MRFPPRTRPLVPRKPAEAALLESGDGDCVAFRAKLMIQIALGIRLGLKP